MSTAEIIETVRKLKAAERLEIVEAILNILDESDPAMGICELASASRLLAR